ncbi:hypothetical protein DFH28DRAFT_19848 [Melampsora americana]|nr:hypothetical protein DFH28DRAFT_19848 [Melampsora americana]
MVLNLIKVAILHLLVSQGNCFSTKLSDPSGLPKADFEKFLQNEANPIAKTSSKRVFNSDQYYEPLCSKSKMSFIDINSKVAPGSSQERMLLQDMPAKRKRLDNVIRTSKISRLSKSGFDDLPSDSNIQHSTGHGSSSLSSEMTKDLFSDNPKKRSSSESAPVVVSPQRQERPKSNILKGKNVILADHSHHDMMTKDISNSKLKLMGHQYIIRPQDTTYQVPNKAFQSKRKADRQTVDPLNIGHVTENLENALSSKPASGIQRFYASRVFKQIGLSHLTLLGIDEWFEDLKKDMYRNNRGSNKRYEAIDKIIKKAKDDITIPFLGCLHVFEYQKPAWKDMSKLQTNGWNFMQKLFDQWRAINMEEINRMESKGLASQSYWSDNPMINIKYLLGMKPRQRIPGTLLVEIHMLWTDQFPSLTEVRNIQVDHREFLQLMLGLDSKSVKQFYKIACMNCQSFQSYLTKIGGSRKVSIKKYPHYDEELTLIGAKHAKPELTEDIDNYFKILNDLLSNNLDIDYKEDIKSGSMLFSSAMQKKAQDLNYIKKAIDSARSKVTLVFLGSLVKIYNGRLQPDGIEQVLQSGWSFLKEQFSTWIKYNFRPSQRKKETDMVKLKPVRKNTAETPLEMFHYILTRPNQRAHMNFVCALLNWWIDDLCSRKQAGQIINFEIPSPIKVDLGRAVNDPKSLFLEFSHSKVQKLQNSLF